MRFALLTEISFRHGFFADNCFRDIRVLVPQQTATDMLRHGLLFRALPDRMRLLYNDADPPRRAVLHEQLQLVFDLQLQDNAFYNYTGLQQTDVANSLLLFGNSNVHTSGKLHRKELVCADDIVTNTQEEINIPLFGRIILTLTPDLLPFYEISFAARETHWCYFLMSDNLAALTKPLILDGKSDVQFSGPQQITLPDGKTAQVFISDRPVPLSQRPRHTFRLVAGNDDEQRTIIPVLPSPDIQRISAAGMAAYDRTKDYSEIFLY